MKKDMKRFFISTLIAVIIVFVGVPLITSAQTVISNINYSNSISNSGSISGGISSCSNLTSEGIPGMVGCVIGFFNYFVYIIIALSVVYIVLGAFKMIQSEEGREDAKKTIMYGIIGLFVMISIWGLVNILDNTFKLSGQDARPAPQLIPKGR